MILWEMVGEQRTSRSVAAAEPLSAQTTDESQDSLPRVIPAPALDEGIAALLVPNELAAAVVRNGVPLTGGIHVLRHTDRLDFDDRRYWVAVSVDVETEAYRPEVHGVDQYCYVTKARLEAGEDIVACPGRPGTPCTAVYRSAVWDKALAANARFRCPSCGFDPNAGDWEPPAPRSGNLQRLFELAEASRR